MMKKVTVKQLMLFSLFMAMAWSASAQMKVGDNPNTINKGSVLELEAKDKGVLYPRVALTASNAWAPLQGTAVAGMTVYNMATVTATTSATTSLSPGFYFWEGDKWNKLAIDGDVATGDLWKEGKNSDGTPNFYFAPAMKRGDTIAYLYENKDHSLYFRKFTSKNLPLTTIGSYWGFNDAGYFIDANHINNANNKDNEVRYQAQFRGIFTDNAATRKIRHLLGGTNVASLGAPTKIEGYVRGTALTGIDAGTVSGFVTRADNFSSGTVDNLFGLQTFSKNYGKGNVGNMYGIQGHSWNTGSVAHQHGLKVTASVLDNASANNIYGGVFGTFVDSGATVSNSVQGLRADVIINGGTVNNTFSHGLRNILTLKNGGNMKFFEGLQTTLHTEAGTTLDEYKGFRMAIPISGNAGTIKNMYGIYLDAVNKATDKNYAIYTNAGDIRLGELAGTGALSTDTTDKVVVADTNGILKTKDPAQLMAEASVWKKNTTTGDIELIDSSLKNDVAYTATGYKSVPKGMTTIQEYDYVSNTLLNTPISSLEASHLNIYNSKNLNYKVGVYGDNTFYINSNRFQIDALKDNNGTNSNVVLNNTVATIPATYSSGIRLLRTGSFTAEKLDANNTTELTSLVARTFDAGKGNTNYIFGVGSAATIQKAGGAVDKIFAGSFRASSLDANLANVNDFYGVWSRRDIKGAGNITNSYGFYSDNYVRSSEYTGIITNSYDLFTNGNVSNTTNQYGVYINGNAKTNYFEGTVGIGTNTPQEKLSVHEPFSGSEIGISSGNPTGAVGIKLYTARPDLTKGLNGASIGSGNQGWYMDAKPMSLADNVKGDFRIAYFDNTKWISHITIKNISGNMGIGLVNSSPTEKLEVNGNVKAKTFIATAAGSVFPDYVFETYYNGNSELNNDYDFMSLSEVAAFTKANNHLPGYESAKAIAEKGSVDLGATQLKNVEKIEELYLHLIEKEKEVQTLKEKLEAQEMRLQKLEKLLVK